MDSNSQQTDRDTITQILKKINNAWTKGNPDRLNDFFHKDIVIAKPGIERAVLISPQESVCDILLM